MNSDLGVVFCLSLRLVRQRRVVMHRQSSSRLPNLTYELLDETSSLLVVFQPREA